MELDTIVSQLQSLWHEVVMTVAVSFWVGNILGQTFASVVALLCLPRWWAVSILLVQLVLATWPLDDPPWLADRFLNFVVQCGMQYCSLKVTCEDRNAIKEGQTYVVGLEPHSALPSALPVMFNKYCQALPGPLRNIKTLATSTVFYLPATRLPWYWLGIRSIGRESFERLLATGNSVALVPGGVSECMVMKQGQEVMYLSKRKGFVRIALHHGAHLLPVFAFGQSDTYSWIRPGPPFIPQAIVDWVRKGLGFIPLMMWGRWGTPVPHKVPMHVVFGKPIELPKLDNPTDEEVQKYLDVYIHAMERLCHTHKDAAGYGQTVFRVV